MDGIDVALIETDGLREVKRGPSMTFPYSQPVRTDIATALAHARSMTDRHQRPGLLPGIERTITEHHASAVSAFLRKTGTARRSIDVIGFHGQTVLHRPEARLTVQLGDARLLAELTQLPVVADLRIADIEAGGQGAPLAPIYHWAVSHDLSGSRWVLGAVRRPLAILNIGGVANITAIGADTADGSPNLVAFDTGPGNALIDDWMAKKAGQPCDFDGAAAAAGQVNEDVVQFYTNHAFFSAPPPKSLDRNAFYWDMMEWMDVADGAATLTAFTVEAVRKALCLLPELPKAVIVTGGGRNNATLMRQLSDRLEADVLGAEAAGLDGDSLEAEAWAYLAVRSNKGLDITFPGTTGVIEPMTGGTRYDPDEPLRAVSG